MDYYNNNAASLFQRYQSLPPDKVHQAWLELLPGKPGMACDIGAGSGRDARWLAAQGWDVIAVEPSSELRQLAVQHPPLLAPGVASELAPDTQKVGGITWLDDSLPELKKLRAFDQRFNLILMSAVWMHLPAEQQKRAMRIVSDLLAPGGLLVITLRIGPDDNNRFYPAETEDVIALAQGRALINKKRCRTDDLLRPEIEWDTLVFGYDGEIA